MQTLSQTHTSIMRSYTPAQWDQQVSEVQRLSGIIMSDTVISVLAGLCESFHASTSPFSGDAISYICMLFCYGTSACYATGASQI